LCLLLAFLLPVFPKLLPAVIFLLMVNWVVSGIYVTTIPKLFREKWRILTLSFASLYILYVIGMLYSTDYVYGWFDLEVKLSLLVFPLIFATSDPGIFNHFRTKLFFGFFIGGCMTGSLVLFGHSLIVNERWGVPDAFYYTNLSWYFHSSYLAMYYTFGVGITLYYLANDFFKKSIYKSITLSIVILYLEALIFLLSSKAGLIMLVTTEILFIILLIFRKEGYLQIIFFTMMMGIVFIGFSRIFPYAFKRISKADSMVSSLHSIQTNPNDGTVARMEIWKVSIGLVGQHFIFGVGTGDVKDALMDAYRQQNLYPVFKKNLNAHNQYLQTFITLGVIGLGLLVALLWIPVYRSLRKGSYIYTLLLLIFSINILFESMLETQAGVVFYAFFNAFFFSQCTYANDHTHLAE
jgi:O-antigen ligase